MLVRLYLNRKNPLRGCFCEEENLFYKKNGLFALLFDLRRRVIAADGSTVVLFFRESADLLEHFLHALVLLEDRVHTPDFGT